MPKKKILEQYERLNTSQCNVTFKGNLYRVALGSKEHDVSGDLSTCRCSFHCQYLLPCVHILAARQFAGKELFIKASIPDRWRKDHFLSETCATSLGEPVVTSSVQTRTPVKLDTPQERYLYAFRELCEMSKAAASALSNYGVKEMMEKLSSCDAFFRNLTTFAQNQTAVDVVGAADETHFQVRQVNALNDGDNSVTAKLRVPVVKARRGRPKKVKVLKHTALPLKNKISLSMVQPDVLKIYRSYSLSDKDINDVAQGRSLSDSVINVAQWLIHNKFPYMSGFQDVLLGQGLKFSRVNGVFMQILHTQNPDHWLTVTNAGAPENTVFMYNSLDQDIPTDAVKQICNMLKLQSPMLTINSAPVQYQGATLDCGLFAIANMYSIASDYEPANLHFDQSSMRDHLLKCIQKGAMDDFLLSQCPTARVRSRVLTVSLHCVCRQPVAFSVAADIACAVCSKTFHSMCLGKSVLENLTGRTFSCSHSCIAIAERRALNGIFP